MGSSFLFPATLILRFAGPERAKNLAGKSPPTDSDPLSDTEFEKLPLNRQDNSPHAAPKFQQALLILSLPIVQDRLRRRPACLDLCADLLQVRTKRFNLLLLFRYSSLQSPFYLDRVAPRRC